jgi:hypothetical protein
MFVAPQFQHEYIRAVTGSRSLWTLSIFCHCTILSNIYTRHTEVSCQCRLVQQVMPYQSQSHIATDGQSVSLGVEPHLRLRTRYLLLFDNYGLDFVGRPLWWENGSPFCICYWLLPAPSFSGPSPFGLATIFYRLRFETSLFVASDDSQGHGGVIRSRFYTGSLCPSQSQSHISTDGQSVSQSVSKSWCQAQSGSHDQIFITVWQLRSCYCGAPSLTRGRVCLMS